MLQNSINTVIYEVKYGLTIGETKKHRETRWIRMTAIFNFYNHLINAVHIHVLSPTIIVFNLAIKCEFDLTYF